jgi:hypothetical protein
MMENVCAADELLKVRTTAVESPPPEGVIVTVPVYAAFGVTVKLVEAAFRDPPDGPVNVYLVAGAIGVTELEALEAALFPFVLLAITVQV